MRLPSVSVIVPSYNYGSVLTGCVESVLCQEDVSVSVLIMDDCSPDDTHAVGRLLTARDDRVHYHRNARNLGLIGTANAGLERADGDFVVLLSADDLLTPGALKRATTVMQRSPTVGMVYGHAPYWHDGAPPPKPSGRWRDTTIYRGSDWIRRRCRTAQNCISSPEVVVRTSVQRAVGGYDPVCHHASDLNMWLRIAAEADIAYIRGVPQAIYRIHADSMLRSANSPMVDLQERRRAWESFFDTCADSLQDGGKLRQMATAAMARQALWQASRAIDRNLLSGRDALPFDQLVSFALDVHPEARRLREWHGLRLRRRLGAGRSRFFPFFLATGAAHRLRGHVNRVRWERTGV